MVYIPGHALWCKLVHRDALLLHVKCCTFFSTSKTWLRKKASFGCLHFSVPNAAANLTEAP